MTPNQEKKKVIQGQSLQREQTFESQFGRWYLVKKKQVPLSHSLMDCVLYLFSQWEKMTGFL